MKDILRDGPEDSHNVTIKVSLLKDLLRRIDDLEVSLTNTATHGDQPEPLPEDTLEKIKRMANMLGYKLIPLDEAMAARAMFQQGKYEHTFLLSFTARSNLEDGEDMTSDMFKNAIYHRMESLDTEGLDKETVWKEALLPPENPDRE